MDSYYLNRKAQDNGNYEVHKNSCAFMPDKQNRLYIGYFNNCHKALAEAKKVYSDTVTGCRSCCPECQKI